MEGTGYFWKGLADAFGGWRDKKFADDKSARDREMQREELMIGSRLKQQQGDFDRANSHSIALFGGRSNNLGYLSASQNAWLDAASAKRKQAGDIRAGVLPGQPISPEDALKIKTLEDGALQDERMATQFAVKAGATADQQPSFIDQLRAARNKRLGKGR